MKFLKLLLVRHAHSVGNQQKRMQGHQEFELTEEGRIQAEKLAHRLVAESWRPTHVYSSPLKRAAQTAEIVRSRFLAEPLPAVVSDLADEERETTEGLGDRPPAAIPLVYADELKEFQNGIFAGLTWAEAKERYPELCDRLEHSPDWIPIPGAETLTEARDRVQQFIERVLAQHSDGDQVLIVSHSWILQHLIAAVLGSDRSWRIHIRNTALFEFWLDHTRWFRSDDTRLNTDLWQIRRFNDAHHLQ